jgi:hypothetical protein
MSAQPFASRPSWLSPAALGSLELGLRVRVETRGFQRSLFSGAERLSARELTSELAELVSSLRVRSFALRAELEQLMSALMVNVDSGFWSLARRAALDLGGTLDLARKRRLVDEELSVRGGAWAFRIAPLCGKEVL